MWHARFVGALLLIVTMVLLVLAPSKGQFSSVGFGYVAVWLGAMLAGRRP